MSEILGILGGMGPLASAEFLKTLYEFNMQAKEQSAPRCILYSDPSIPDRTEAILRNDTEEVLQRIVRGLDRLRDQGATRYVIACISSHYLADRLPALYRNSMISLIEVALKEAQQFPGNCLLLATTGTVQAKSFQQHPLWPQLEGKLKVPNPQDQRRIHDYIYSQIKPNLELVDEDLFRHLKDEYEVDAFVAGCTEFHLVNKRLLESANPDFRFIDPLYSIGRELPKLLHKIQNRER